MQNIKNFIITLDGMVFLFWGFNIIDLATLLLAQSFTGIIDEWVKVAFAFVGLIYTILRAHHFYFKYKIERKIREQELIKMIKENDKIFTPTS
jgi:hypothetical protein